MAVYCFLEYTYDDQEYPEDAMSAIFDSMGFSKNAKTECGNVTVWTQDLAIIFVRKTSGTGFNGLSGMGISVNKLPDNLEIDTVTKLPYEIDSQGLKVFFVPQNISSDFSLDANFQKEHSYLSKEQEPLHKISGVVICCSNLEEAQSFYRELGFSTGKMNDVIPNLTCSNNLFTVVFRETKNTNSISHAIFETHDVFNATLYYTVKDFDVVNFILDMYDSFGELNYKINGYNCVAYGNQDSYVIENVCKDALPNMNMIFRMRKQYLPLCPLSLEMENVA
jgi:hypothetical protein